MKELKSCPFCGGEVNVTYRNYDKVFVFHHKQKNCPFSAFYVYAGREVKSLKDAADAWNRRVE